MMCIYPEVGPPQDVPVNDDAISSLDLVGFSVILGLGDLSRCGMPL